ncbi:MAG: hypothetical protein K0S06_1553 [Microvirga sp.]|jgi:hypothetical protein|nr:hypothetical protein [Microvirga sp.]
MTKDQIDAIFDRAREWPERYREDAARFLLAIDPDRAGVYELSEEEARDIDAALAEVERGEVASDEEVQAFFAQFRR